MLRSKLGLTLALVIILTCFAANSAITRFLVLDASLSPFVVTLIRFLSGLIMLQALAQLRPDLFVREPVSMKYVPGALFLGSYAFAISYGYQFISAAAGVLIFYGFVVMTMTTYSVIVDREPLTLRLIVGQLLGLAGIFVITSGGIEAVRISGAVLMAVTGTAWGLHSVAGRGFTNPFGYTYNSFLLFGAAGLVLLALAVPITGSGLLAGLGSVQWGWGLFMGMISTALSYALWHRVLRHITASQAGMTQLFVPVGTGLMGVIILGERLTASLVLGGVLVLVGIFLNSVKGTESPAESTGVRSR